MNFLNLNTRSLLIVFFMLLFGKAILTVAIFYWGNNFFGGGNDSDYYHAYAIGESDEAANAWAILLRWLHDAGLYSRNGVSNFLKFLGFIVIPFLVAKLSSKKNNQLNRHIFWYAAVIISIYPTLFYYTTDMYRDVFMVFLWITGLFIFQNLSNSKKTINKVFIYCSGILVSLILFEFRPYLGVGYLIALIFSPFYSFRRCPLFFSICVFISALFFLYCFGLLNPILEYRSIFGETMTGGSNLGIRFSSASSFFSDLILTTAFQLFGLFLINMSTIAVFIVESLPFILFFRYVIKNRKYSSKFVDYLIVFFIAYSTIWLLGNDNLGTAVRLRLYSYISIFIAFCTIYQNKNDEPKYCMESKK